MKVGSQTTEREESVALVPSLRLTLQWLWPERRVVVLGGAQLSIGRDDDAVIKLDGPGVSRHHAELYRQGPIYVLRDLGSTNGTRLNGHRIEHAPIAEGAVLRIGDWVGHFTLLGDNLAHFTELAPGLFGGAELAELLEPMRRAAPTTLPVLLTGATGTGKERFARALHHLSGRQGPFFAVNCAALPEHMAEAELFGYRKGAFTGAERSSNGYFRAAHGGTLFLDEVAELPAPVQAKLLRVLEDGQILGLGEANTVSVDVRVVSAVQEPLANLVAAKRFRQDLAARLTGLTVAIPPLAARRGDVPGLFRQFLTEHSGGRPPGVESRLVEALCLHDWPQNVRELELLTRTLLAVNGHEPTLKRRHLPAELAALCVDDAASTTPAPPRSRRDHDLSRLREELGRNGGNIKAAAESLGISRQRVYRLLESEGPEALAVHGGSLNGDGG